MRRFLDFLSIVAVSTWIGGLTFYAMFVVPTGGELIGETLQGFITRRVTTRLNLIGAVSLALFAGQLIVGRRRSRILWAMWTVQVVVLLVLVFLHFRLSGMLDPRQLSVREPAAFYQWHRAYLIATALQWLVGLGMLATCKGLAYNRHSPVDSQP